MHKVSNISITYFIVFSNQYTFKLFDLVNLITQSPLGGCPGLHALVKLTWPSSSSLSSSLGNVGMVFEPAPQYALGTIFLDIVILSYAYNGVYF